MQLPEGTRIDADDGISVEQVGLNELLYREGERSVRIVQEHLVSPIGVLIYLGYKDNWDQPFHKEEIKEADWKRIEMNILNSYQPENQHVEFRYPCPGEKEAIKKHLNKIKHK